MLTYDYENITESLYEHTYSCIKNDIISGKIAPGERLPSKRAFARNNGISTITIQNAYDQLVSEGYICAIEKKGYFAAELDGIAANEPKADKCTSEPRAHDERAYAFDLSSNEMDPENFPFSNWAKVLRDVLTHRKDDLMKISPTTGVKELRRATADHLRSFRGMAVDPDQIVVGAGTEYLYGLLVQLLGKEKRYAIEDPGYKKLVSIYGQYGISPVYADIDVSGVSIESLRESGADIAHICPNHHFPTGITMPADRRYSTLAWANEREGRYVIEDDYDSEFRSRGRPIPTLFSIDNCEKVIYMNTFSKTLTPTIRVSYMVVPTHIAEMIRDRLSFLSCTVSNFEQYTLAGFIDRGFLEKHINRMRLFYIRKRREMLDIIRSSRLGNRCEIIDNGAGLHFIIRLDTAISDRDLGEALRKKDLLIRALSEYYLAPKDIKEHMFIVNYSNIAKDHLAKACDVICGCLEKG